MGRVHVTNYPLDYFTEVALGNVTGVRRNGWAGHHPDLSSGDGEATVWAQGGRRILLADDTQLFVSSSNDDDDGLVIVLGIKRDLAGNYNQTTAIAFLNGQTQVALSVELFRINVHLADTTGTQVLGDIFIAESTATVGGVPTDKTKIQSRGLAGRLFSYNTFFTVPDGVIMTIHNIEVFTDKLKAVEVFLNNREPGQTQWTSATPFIIYESGHRLEFPPPFAIPGRVELEFSATTQDENAKVTILVNSQFTNI